MKSEGYFAGLRLQGQHLQFLLITHHMEILCINTFYTQQFDYGS